MVYSNAQKLAAVVSEWARPAIAQIAAQKIGNMGWMRSLQQGVVGMGLVDKSYNITKDIEPFLMPAINAMIEPTLISYFGNIPDEAIPKMAHEIVAKMGEGGGLSLFDGAVYLDNDDINELRMLLDANLPIDENNEPYKVKKDE